MADIHHNDTPGYLPRTDEEAGNPLLALTVLVLVVGVFAIAWTYGAVGAVGALQAFGPELAAAPRSMQ